jgi:hypothetical protein
MMGNLKSMLSKYYWSFLDATHRWWPDSMWLKIAYKAKHGRKLHLKCPKAYTEKLQWLKIHDHNPLYTTLVDKYAVKEYVSQKIGSQYVFPCFGVWNNFDEIDFDKLPNQFVLKCTHDSGGIVICKDKESFDKKAAKDLIERALKLDFWRWSREWAYKNVPPRILAEQYMVDESGEELKDYKLFCFNGEPRYIEVDFDRFTHHHRNIYDVNWNLQECEIKFPSDRNRVIPRPQNLDEMLEMARILSKGFPHVRIDLYNIDGRAYFGEFTFYHGGGWEEFRPLKWDYIFGDCMKLPID